MNKYCKYCKKEVEISEHPVTFKDGTKHIKGSCPDCDTYLGYIAQNRQYRDSPLKYGKYKGKKLAEIKKIDREYLVWLYDKSNNSFKKLIDNVLSAE